MYKYVLDFFENIAQMKYEILQTYRLTAHALILNGQTRAVVDTREHGHLNVTKLVCVRSATPLKKETRSLALYVEGS